jgi:hypothetical protein
MRCYVHHWNRANWHCDACGRDICNECIVFSGERPMCRACAGVPYPPPPLIYDRPPFPPPWDERIARNYGRLALAAGILASCLFLALANMAFRMVSDPENGLSYLGSSGDNGLYRDFFIVYFAISGVTGMVLATLSHSARIRHKEICLLFIGLPGLLALPPFMYAALVPFARGLAAVAPPLSLLLFTYVIGASPYAALAPARRVRLRQLALAAMAISVLLVVVFEESWSQYKVAGSVIMYSGGLVLGLLALAISANVFTGAGGALKDGREAGWPAADGPADGPAVGRAPDGPEGRPRRARMELAGPWKAVLALAIVLPIVFLPPLDRLAAGPRLEIHGLNGDIGKTNWTLTVTIINRGGQATDGPIEVQVSNGTGYNMSVPVGRVEGFGSTRVTLKGPAEPSATKRRITLYVKLVYKGAEVDSGQISLPPPVCLIMPSLVPVALAAGALAGVRRKRLRDR